MNKSSELESKLREDTSVRGYLRWQLISLGFCVLFALQLQKLRGGAK